jgi:hypothetical protein
MSYYCKYVFNLRRITAICRWSKVLFREFLLKNTFCLLLFYFRRILVYRSDGINVWTDFIFNRICKEMYIVFGCIWIDFYGLELNFVERFSPKQNYFFIFHEWLNDIDNLRAKDVKKKNKINRELRSGDEFIIINDPLYNF